MRPAGELIADTERLVTVSGDGGGGGEDILVTVSGECGGEDIWGQ